MEAKHFIAVDHFALADDSANRGVESGTIAPTCQNADAHIKIVRGLGMKWDSSRSVPWKRLSIEWAVVATIVAVVSFSATDNRKFSSYVALVLGGVVYLGVGATMAKFGYQRKTLKQMRSEVAAAPRRKAGSSPSSAAAPATARPKPAPTKRTSGGPGNRPAKRRR